MTNFDDVIKKETKEHNPNWPKIPDHPYRILIVANQQISNQILIKFIYMLKIHMNQNINF